MIAVNRAIETPEIRLKGAAGFVCMVEQMVSVLESIRVMSETDLAKDQ
jgi:hypothetical protein